MTDPVSTPPNNIAKMTETGVPLDTPSRFAQSGIMKIYVGPTRKLFEVHKDLLVAKSGYFKRMLSNKDWQETKDGEVYWTDEDETPEAVESIINMLYGKAIKIDTVMSEDIFRCYSMAHKREMLELKNTAIDGYRMDLCKSKNFEAADRVKLVRDMGLEETPLHVLLFKLLIFVYSTDGKYHTEMHESLQETREDLKDLDPSIMADIIEGMMIFQWKKFADPKEGEGCYFHDQTDGSSCEKPES